MGVIKIIEVIRASTVYLDKRKKQDAISHSFEKIK